MLYLEYRKLNERVIIMAYKLYGRQVFETEVNGKTYTFTCYGQSTSYGFRHICTLGYTNTTKCEYIKHKIIAKATYYNRTWESFEYETVLRKAIENLDETKEVKEKLHKILIERTAEEEHEKCERQVKAFENLWNGLSDENKEHIKNGVGENGIQSEEQANAVMAVMGLMSLMQG